MNLGIAQTFCPSGQIIQREFKRVQHRAAHRWNIRVGSAQPWLRIGHRALLMALLSFVSVVHRRRRPAGNETGHAVLFFAEEQGLRPMRFCFCEEQGPSADAVLFLWREQGPQADAVLFLWRSRDFRSWKRKAMTLAFTGCGKTPRATKFDSFVTRARLQPGRKCMKRTDGASAPAKFALLHAPFSAACLGPGFSPPPYFVELADQFLSSLPPACRPARNQPHAQ